MRKIVAEFIATFTLMLALLEALLLSVYGDSPTIVLVTGSIVAGGAVTILIYGFGKISGAHMNPAVSTAMWLDHQLNTQQLFGYVIAQLAGSYCAAKVIDLTHSDMYYFMGGTVPSISEGWAWLLECALTFVLVLTIFRFSDERFPKMQTMGPVVIGLVVALEIFFAANYSGASMNPARSFGPAIILNMTKYHWLYFSAPIAGAAIARYTDLWFRNNEVTATVQ